MFSAFRSVFEGRDDASEIESRVAVNANEWLRAFADELGTAAPTADEFKALLDLAAEAAHASERVAAPVACWVAAKAGVTPDEALAKAREVDG
jgi:hypothetical protein